MLRTAKDILINLTDDAGTTVTSEVLDLRSIYLLAMQHVSTGTISGTLSLELSADGTNWVAQSTTASVSNAGTTLTQFTDIAAHFGRLVYTGASGTTNTLVVTVNTKGL